MKKLVALLALVLATTVAVLVTPGVARTSITSTCDTIPYSATVWQDPGAANLAVGQTMQMVMDSTAILRQNGSIRDHIEVDVNGHDFQVGIISNGNGIETYGELDGTLIWHVNASKNHNYTMLLEHTTSTTYTIWDGNGHTSTKTLGSTTQSWELGLKNKQSSSGTCNSATFSNTSESPFTLTNWNVTSNSPFFVTNRYGGGFDAAGG
jgi:uncharacterized protein YdeI (BOF family)